MNNTPTHYQIEIQGHLNNSWQSWFDDLEVTLTNEGNTLLNGAILDQATLHGVLKKIRNLGLTLIAINQQADQIS